MDKEHINNHITKKDWSIFIAFATALLLAGFLIGVMVGSNHPSAKAMENKIADIRTEVSELETTYHKIIENQDIMIEYRDSLIKAMKMEITKGEPYGLPIIINIP